MNLLRYARRLFWPSVMTVTTVGAYVGRDEIWVFLRLTPAELPIQLITGSLSYFAVAWLGGRLVGLALERVSARQRRVPKLLQELVQAGFFIVALTASLMLFLGQSIVGALASSGIVLAIVGFAIRNVVADTLSGVALGLEAPFRIGDWIDIEGEAKGQVVEIGWRTTRLLTRDSTYMILPNSNIARQRMINYSAPRKHYRSQVTVVLGHEVSVEEARRALLSGVAKCDTILPEPAPDVRALTYSSEGITYAVRYWVPSFRDEIDCRSAVLASLDKALRAHSFEPPAKSIRLLEPQAKSRSPEGIRSGSAGGPQPALPPAPGGKAGWTPGPWQAVGSQHDLKDRELRE